MKSIINLKQHILHIEADQRVQRIVVNQQIQRTDVNQRLQEMGVSSQVQDMDVNQWMLHTNVKVTNKAVAISVQDLGTRYLLPTLKCEHMNLNLLL